MELEEFIYETIKQVIDGVKKGKEHGSNNGAMVNASFKDMQSIKFDVAITTTDGSKQKAGMGLFVGSLGIGAQGQSESASQSVSRIEFSVPIEYP